MVSKKLSARSVFAAVVGASLIIAATSAFAAGPEKGPSEAGAISLPPLTLCEVAVPSPTPQIAPQVPVCNDWTGAAGGQAELINGTGQNCALAAAPGSQGWPFAQSSPIAIPEGTGVFVTLKGSLAPGGYSYSVSCCNSDAMKTVTIIP